MGKLSTGADFFDTFLDGGYDSDVVTTLYGPSGSGKTNLCLLAAVKVAEQGKKVLFLDTEGGIAVERIRQLTINYESVLDKIMFLKPLSFQQQIEIFENLRSLVTEEIGLIVVDSIAMLYRLALGGSDDIYNVNTALGRQIAFLVEMARSKSIPVLITNQVYSDFDKKDAVKMVGGDLLKYGSKCLIELRRFSGCRGMVLQKHRHLPEGGELRFNIIGTGITELSDN